MPFHKQNYSNLFRYFVALNKCLKFGVLLLVAHPAFTSEMIPLTWDDCVKMAIQKNPDLQAAHKNVLAQRAEYRQSFNGYSPQINLSSSYRDSDTPTDNHWSASADAVLSLFNAGTNASIRSAAASYKRAEAAYKLSSSNLRFSLRQAFAQLLFAQLNIGVEESIRDIRRNNAKLVSFKYESGRESKGNMLRSNAELRQAEADVASAMRSVRTAQQELNRQLGKDDFSLIVTTGILASGPLALLPPLEQTAKIHPRIEQLLRERDIALANVSSARSAYWPSLSANYSRTANDSVYFPNNLHWTAGAVLSLPLFGRGITSAYESAKAARRNLEKTDQDIRSALNDIKSGMESAWATWADRLDQVLVQKQFLEASRQRNDESLVRYSSGLMSFEDWEQAVSDLVRYEKGVIQAERDAVLAEAAWDESLGKLLEAQ